MKETFVERLPNGVGEDDDYAGGDLDLMYVEGEEGGDGEAVVVEAEEGGVGLQLLEEGGGDLEEDTPGLQVDLQKKSLHVVEEGFLGWIFCSQVPYKILSKGEGYELRQFKPTMWVCTK